MPDDTINENRILTPKAPGTDCPLPLPASGVAAGFPSPADDYVEGQLDLNEHLIRRPSSTFFVRASGESMVGAGIHPGDLLIVDRSLEAVSGKVVIAILGGELTVKRLHVSKAGIRLLPENPDFPEIAIDDPDALTIWGVVTHVIHPL